MMQNIHNDLYTAMITPMLQDGSVDFVSFKNLLFKQQEADCGVLILGSTGEALSFSLEEQCKIIDFVARLDLTVPILVGIGGFKQSQQLHFMDHCHRYSNINGFLMVTPMYAKPGYLSQLIWFTTLLDHSNIPCMLYNLPSRTGINLSYKVLQDLCCHPKIWSIKEASGDILRFISYSDILKDSKAVVYSGEDGLMSELSKVGARGLVSVISNLWPKETKLYVSRCMSKKINNIEKNIWKKATAACFSVANPIPVKCYLHYTKVIKSSYLRPPLISDEMSDINSLDDISMVIQKWFKENSV